MTNATNFEPTKFTRVKRPSIIDNDYEILILVQIYTKIFIYAKASVFANNSAKMYVF